MDKNWLIRTRSNHILGPISKEKVLELYNNGSIKPDDEVCTGNGYWFFIRETDLVNKFLIGQEVQTFNPISEAKDVLTSTGIPEIPDRPDDDITLVNGINLSLVEGGAFVKEEEKIPEKASETKLEVKTPEIPQDKKKIASGPVPRVSHPPKKKLKQQGYLKYLGVLGFILLFMMIYFRKAIIQSIFHGEVARLPTISFFPTAYAQVELPEKKKSF